MANVAISKPSKRSSRKSFKLNLPFLCREADVLAPAAVPSPSSRRRDRTDELRDVFRHFDQDRDGKISGRELRAFFMSVGEEIPVEEAEAVIAELDSDGDRLLDFGDFVGLMEREGGKEEEEDEDLRKAFEMFEVEKGSGRITPRGVQRILSQLGDERSFEECEAMIRPYDLDGNGEIDFHEFHQMMS